MGSVPSPQSFAAASVKSLCICGAAVAEFDLVPGVCSARGNYDPDGMVPALAELVARCGVQGGRDR